MGLSEELFDRAVKVIPGGVNSPVRAYGAIGIAPRFIDRADGCHIYDVDGKEYVDYIDSWGPMILGHNFPEVKESVLKACEKGLSFGCATAIEVEMAEFICDHIPHVDMVRMVNSGTEAVMSAVRVARGFTGKNKIIKFALMEQADGQTAAVIVEAVGANMGVVPPKKGFLEGLRKLCDEYGALLIFDEVITGFRLAFGGAAEYFGVTPDLVTYGKIIGAGMPVGAYGGRREIMELVSPVGKVYQAGTLSGNPIAMAAGLTQLKYLYEHQGIYKDLEEKGKRLYGGMEKILAEKNLPYHINYVSSLGSLFFTEQEVVDYTSAKSSDTKAFSEYFKGMLAQGIHMAPSQFEAMFLSVAHTDEIIDQTLEAVRNYFTK